MCESYVLQSFMFLQVQQRLVVVHEKVRYLQLHFHLMWSRWSMVFILLQCSISLLYRKSNNKNVTTYLLLPAYCNFFAPNTRPQIHTHARTRARTHTHMYKHILVPALKFEVTRSLTQNVYGLKSSANYSLLLRHNL